MKKQVDTKHTLVSIGGGCQSVVEAGVEGESVLHGGGKMWKAYRKQNLILFINIPCTRSRTLEKNMHRYKSWIIRGSCVPSVQDWASRSHMGLLNPLI
jgi:hypothetical protein